MDCCELVNNSFYRINLDSQHSLVNVYDVILLSSAPRNRCDLDSKSFSAPRHVDVVDMLVSSPALLGELVGGLLEGLHVVVEDLRAPTRGRLVKIRALRAKGGSDRTTRSPRTPCELAEIHLLDPSGPLSVDSSHVHKAFLTMNHDNILDVRAFSIGGLLARRPDRDEVVRQKQPLDVPLVFLRLRMHPGPADVHHLHLLLLLDLLQQRPEGEVPAVRRSLAGAVGQPFPSVFGLKDLLLGGFRAGLRGHGPWN